MDLQQIPEDPYPQKVLASCSRELNLCMAWRQPGVFNVHRNCLKGSGLELGDAFSGIFAAQVLKTLLKEYHHTSTYIYNFHPHKWGFPVSRRTWT